MSARPQAHHVQRVVGLTDAFIGGDRHVDETTQLGQFGHRRAGLFEVLQGPVGGQRSCRRHGLCDAPTAVCVHSHRRHVCAHGVDAGHVVGQRLARLGDLHLGGARARKAGQHLGDVGRGDCRHGRVDRDAVAARRRRRDVRRLDARRQPRGGLGRFVLEESTELAPTRGAVDERQLANRDAAELHPHWQRDDVQAVDDVGE